jgi:hypothetical protein
VANLDKTTKLKHTNRNNLIEKAIKVWEKGYIEEALKIGYQRMVKEDS